MDILVAEDSKFYLKILAEMLYSWQYRVVTASDGIQALKILEREDRPRLAIIDWEMPGMDGLELCRMVRSWDKSGYIYIILLTAKGDKESIVRGLKAGADDYIVKPFEQEVLKWRLKIGERIIALENKIRQLADTDPLTGVLNRRAFMNRLDVEIARCKRSKEPLALIMLDLDNFKSVNDNYGHITGDKVLSMVAYEIKMLVRKYDSIGRYGGEEFVICLPGASLSEASEIADRLRRKIEETVVPVDSGPSGGQRGIKVTASFGVSVLGTESSAVVDALLKKTDEALYLAKRQGKNRVVSRGCNPLDL